MNEQEFKRLYQKKRNGQYLTREELEQLKSYLRTLSINEQRSLISKTALQFNESEDDIETFIEKDIKRN